MKKVFGSFLVISAIALSSVGMSQIQVAKKPSACGKTGCRHVIEVAVKAPSIKSGYSHTI